MLWYLIGQYRVDWQYLNAFWHRLGEITRKFLELILEFFWANPGRGVHLRPLTIHFQVLKKKKKKKRLGLGTTGGVLILTTRQDLPKM